MCICYNQFENKNETFVAKINAEAEKCCKENHVPDKCLGMCESNQTPAIQRGLSNFGHCRSYLEAIKQCKTLNLHQAPSNSSATIELVPRSLPPTTPSPITTAILVPSSLPPAAPNPITTTILVPSPLPPPAPNPITTTYKPVPIPGPGKSLS